MAMDVPRGKEVARKRLIKRIVYITVAALAIGGATIALARLKPAAPSVDMSGQWPGSVKRGPIEIQVRGLGRLTPQEIHFIAAAQDSRVSAIVHRAGVTLKSNDVILTLADPDLETGSREGGMDAQAGAGQSRQSESQAGKRQAGPAGHARRVGIHSHRSQAHGRPRLGTYPPESSKRPGRHVSRLLRPINCRAGLHCKSSA